MGIEIGVRPEIAVRSRIQVLHNVVHELARGFGVSNRSLRTIQTGILEQQLIAKIHIYYIDGRDTCVGRITMDIDWSEHQVRATSADGSNVEVERGRSIAEQVSRTYALLVGHTAALREALHVKRTETWYTYRQDVLDDPTRLRNARRLLGTAPGQKPPSPPVDVELDFSSRNLPELSICIEH